MEHQNNPHKLIVNEDDGLIELVEALQDIDEDLSSAKLNEISMIDSNGSRIFY